MHLDDFIFRATINVRGFMRAYLANPTKRTIDSYNTRGKMKMIPKRTNHLIDKELKKAKAASMIVGVVSKDEMEIESYLHHYYEGYDPENLIVEIGSVTKTFTGTLLAKLVTENVITLDDSVCPFVPEFKKALTYNGQEVTFRHLATHTASLPKDDVQTIRRQMKENPDLKLNPFSQYNEDDFFHFFEHHRPKRAFGKKWAYSNMGVTLLGHVLAKILNTTYEDAIQEHILDPLGMNETYFTVPKSKDSRYVHAVNKTGQVLPQMEINLFNPAGGIKSTVLDMLTYLRYQMNVRETTPELAKAIDLTHERQHLKAMKGFDSGLTWMIDQPKWAPYPIIHHSGTTIGFHTYCGFIKELEIAVMVVSTVQINFSRAIKILTRKDGLINTNIAYSILKKYSKKADRA